MIRPRVVLDTNCYISAFTRPNGRLAYLVSAWNRRVFIPVICAETIAELERVLAYKKFDMPPAERKKHVTNLRYFAETFPLSAPFVPMPGLRDSTDSVFIHLAREAKTDYLVSGDAHLLELKETITDVEIISPREFLGKLG